MKMRGLKPDFWTDEKVVDVGPFARLLFMGLWQMACDNGHLPDSPKRIKMSILPADTVDVDELLDELATAGLIIRDAGWITVPNLARHQRIDRRYFLCCEHDGCTPPPVEKGTSKQASHDGHTTGKAPNGKPGTTGTRRGHGVRTTGPRDEGEGEGERKEPSSEIASDLDASTIDDHPTPEVVDLCEHLAERVRTNGHPAKVGKLWHRECRLLIEVDGHTPEQVRKCIDWATADPFWSTNIRSMRTLREKYSTLQAQAKQRPASPASPEPREPHYVPPYHDDADDLEAYQRWYATDHSVPAAVAEYRRWYALRHPEAS